MHRQISSHWIDGLAVFAVCLLVLTGVARIVSTYHVFNQTADEPASLAPGLEWLERGTYKIDPIHPPLARIAIALGPYLSGARMIRCNPQEDVWHQGSEILFSRNRYRQDLLLARVGVLPFFLLATFFVWHWARVRYGNMPAFLATLLFTTSPTVLGHAGVATTDMAITATFIGALLAYIRFLEAPTYVRASVLGLAAGLATLSKFSALVFIPACALALLLWRWLLARGKGAKLVTSDLYRWMKALSLAAIIILVVVWAGYRFSVGPLTDAPRPHVTADHFLGTKGTLHDWGYRVAEAHWMPAPRFFEGINEVRRHDAAGHKSYLLGQVRNKGWWYFFPVALALKNTIPVLVLVAMGMFYLGKFTWAERNWVAAAPVLVALTILLVSMPSHVNVGVRYMLPIFPFLAIIGGVGAWGFWNSVRLRYAGPAVILIVIGWQLASSFRVHPDYLAYFNELAGHHPERFLIDSDLDWGQDLFRLSAILRQKGIKQVSIAYQGSADLTQFNLPAFRELVPLKPTTGWIAISLYRLKLGSHYIPTDSFRWLEDHQLVCLVGRSIRLYYVPDSSTAKPENNTFESPPTDCH